LFPAAGFSPPSLLLFVIQTGSLPRRSGRLAADFLEETEVDEATVLAGGEGPDDDCDTDDRD